MDQGTVAVQGSYMTAEIYREVFGTADAPVADPLAHFALRLLVDDARERGAQRLVVSCIDPSVPSEDREWMDMLMPPRRALIALGETPRIARLTW